MRHPAPIAAAALAAVLASTAANAAAAIGAGCRMARPPVPAPSLALAWQYEGARRFVEAAQTFAACSCGRGEGDAPGNVTGRPARGWDAVM